MNKAFADFLWEDYPSTNTALDQENLNKMNRGINEIDNRVIVHETTKLDKVEAQSLVKDVILDEDTGILKIVRYNGAEKTYSSLLGKISVNFDFNRETQKIILYKADGESEEIDLSAFITEYEFVDSDTISFSTDENGNVSAKVKEGSIEEKHLRPDYLADIKVEVAKAQSSATAAATSETNAKSSENAAKSSEDAAKQSEDNAAGSATSAAESVNTATEKATSAGNSASAANTSAINAKSSENAAKESEDNAKDSETNAAASEANADIYAKKSQSYAVGGTGTRDGEDTDNSEYYCNTAKGFRDEAEQISQSLEDTVDQINNKLKVPEFDIDDDGNLIYREDTPYTFDMDDDGNLRWGVKVA